MSPLRCNTMSQVLSTWTEIRTSDDGISATLYSEWEGGEVKVEDEMWMTQAELDDSRSITSLRLSQETTDALRESGGTESQEMEDPPLVEGDWVIDGNPPPWSEDEPRLQVVDRLDDVTADEYVIEKNRFGEDSTVATANPSYPSDDTVVLCRFGEQMDSDEPYAYPESRLQLDE